MNVIRTHISVDQDLYERAKNLAKRQGISLAELCRRSLAETVHRQSSDKPWMAYAGSVDGDEDEDVERNNVKRMVVYG